MSPSGSEQAGSATVSVASAAHWIPYELFIGSSRAATRMELTHVGSMCTSLDPRTRAVSYRCRAHTLRVKKHRMRRGSTRTDTRLAFARTRAARSTR